jgi:ribulose-bisphosphate carboxylase small chain
MFGMPMFDLKDPAGVLMEVNNCRKTFPNHYIRLMAFDSTRGIESVAMSFIVHRPPNETGYRLERQEVQGRSMRYTTHGYPMDKPENNRYSK